MRSHPHDTAVRRALRALALVPVTAVTLLTANALPALADPPAQWSTSNGVDAIHALLVFLVIPAGLFLVITLLVMIPSMRRNETYRPGEPWRGESEWFGGPSKGVEAVDEQPAVTGSGNQGSQGTDGNETRGGASGRW